jgi:hypothetical protein
MPLTLISARNSDNSEAEAHNSCQRREITQLDYHIRFGSDHLLEDKAQKIKKGCACTRAAED